VSTGPRCCPSLPPGQIRRLKQYDPEVTLIVVDTRFFKDAERQRLCRVIPEWVWLPHRAALVQRCGPAISAGHMADGLERRRYGWEPAAVKACTAFP
jgi:hypothetical protein